METHIEDLIQGSDEWKSFRRNGLGASDAAAVLSIDPWKTKHDLWLDKIGMGKPFIENKDTRRGKEIEPIARAQAEKDLGIIFTPTVRKSRTIDYMIASLDGLSDDNIALEIKGPRNGLHDVIKPNYYAQTQHIMAVIESDWMYYQSWHDGKTKYIRVERDQPFIDKLLEEEAKFWHCVESFTEPECENQYIKRDDREYQEKLMIYLENKKKREFWEALEKEARDNLISLTNENTECNGVKIRQIVKQGAVETKKLYSEMGINDNKLKEFRKEPSKYWMIKEGK